MDDQRWQSRKFWLTVGISAKFSIAFFAGLLSADLWAGSQIMLALIYMGGNVGDSFATSLKK